MRQKLRRIAVVIDNEDLERLDPGSWL